MIAAVVVTGTVPVAVGRRRQRRRCDQCTRSVLLHSRTLRPTTVTRSARQMGAARDADGRCALRGPALDIDYRGNLGVSSDEARPGGRGTPAGARYRATLSRRSPRERCAAGSRCCPSSICLPRWRIPRRRVGAQPTPTAGTTCSTGAKSDRITRMRWSEVPREASRDLSCRCDMVGRAALGVRNRCRRAAVIESEGSVPAVQRPEAIPCWLLRAGNRRGMMRADRREER